jgi:hypothetical protein
MTKAHIIREVQASRKILQTYRRQLMARHQSEPLKPPPVFLLDAVISGLTTLTMKSKKRQSSTY